MSILSRLLGKDDQSILRNLKSQFAVVRSGRGCSPEDGLFSAVIGPVIFFDAGGSEDYRSNGVIFELAAYWFTRADVYLVAKHEEVRKPVCQALYERLKATFAPPLALSGSQFPDLLADRQSEYSRLIGAGSGASAIHFVISNAVHDTIAHGGAPQLGACGKFGVVGALEGHGFMTALISWELSYAKVLHQTLDHVAEAVLAA